MAEKSRYGVPQNVLKLSTTLAMSLHTAPEMQLLPVLTTLPPPTPDERSRELCACSALLLWRAQRACEHSKHLRERIQRHKNVSRIEQG
jgi:hypothetical protein